MHFFRRSVVVLIIFVVLLVVASVFLPTSKKVSNTIHIDADAELVFGQVNELKNWLNWNPWLLKDASDFEYQQFSDSTSGLGARLKLSDKELGLFTMEIIASQPYDEVRVEKMIDDEKQIHSWTLNQQDTGIQVVWTKELIFGFSPVAKFCGLFANEDGSNEMKTGLQQLKVYSENQPRIKQVKVDKVHREEKLWFLSIRDTVNLMEMTNVHGKLYEEISNFMNTKSISSSSSPLAIYHFWSDTLVDIEVGIPISDTLLLEHERVKLNFIDTGNYVYATHRGRYERLPETYFGINEWIRKNKYTVVGAPFEIYQTDPSQESNPEKWLTAIYFPISNFNNYE